MGQLAKPNQELQQIEDAELHPAVRKILEKDPTPETLEKILQIQREYEANMARRAYTAALVALKKDLPTFLDQDKVVDYTSSKGRTYYTHTSLAHMMDVVLPILSKHGFSLDWRTETGAKVIKVTARLTHADGHYEETPLESPPDVSGNKSPAQAVASACTLLKRYTAMALLGLATADMEEDGDDEPPKKRTMPRRKSEVKKAPKGSEKELPNPWIGKLVKITEEKVRVGRKLHAQQLYHGEGDVIFKSSDPEVLAQVKDLGKGKDLEIAWKEDREIASVDPYIPDETPDETPEEEEPPSNLFDDK